MTWEKDIKTPPLGLLISTGVPNFVVSSILQILTHLLIPGTGPAPSVVLYTISIHCICISAFPPWPMTPDQLPPSLQTLNMTWLGSLGAWKLILAACTPLTNQVDCPGVQSILYVAQSLHFFPLGNVTFLVASLMSLVAFHDGWLVYCT